MYLAPAGLSVDRPWSRVISGGGLNSTGTGAGRKSAAGSVSTNTPAGRNLSRAEANSRETGRMICCAGGTAAGVAAVTESMFRAINPGRDGCAGLNGAQRAPGHRLRMEASQGAIQNPPSTAHRTGMGGEAAAGALSARGAVDKCRDAAVRLRNPGPRCNRFDGSGRPAPIAWPFMGGAAPGSHPTTRALGKAIASAGFSSVRLKITSQNGGSSVREAVVTG